MTDAYHALTVAPQPGAPLIFAFHGTGGDERQFYTLAQQLAPGAGVVSPRGDVDERGMRRFFKRTGEGMYDMADLAKRTEKMLGFVAAWRAKFPQSPVYAFGYSNGANILAACAMQEPQLFDRIALLHPLIPWRPAPTPDLAGRGVLVTAGQRDPIAPWPVTQRLLDWIEAQGATLSTHVHAGGHELIQSEVEALHDFVSRDAEHISAAKTA